MRGKEIYRIRKYGNASYMHRTREAKLERVGATIPMPSGHRGGASRRAERSTARKRAIQCETAVHRPAPLKTRAMQYLGRNFMSHGEWPLAHADVALRADVHEQSACSAKAQSGTPLTTCVAVHLLRTRSRLPREVQHTDHTWRGHGRGVRALWQHHPLQVGLAIRLVKHT